MAGVCIQVSKCGHLGFKVWALRSQSVGTWGAKCGHSPSRVFAFVVWSADAPFVGHMFFRLLDCRCYNLFLC